jgi:hypothetical protein
VVLTKQQDANPLQRLTFAEEDRPRFTTAPWGGEYRWFRSVNVVDLQHYRSPAEKQRICANLLHRPAWRYTAVKSA